MFRRSLVVAACAVAVACPSVAHARATTARAAIVRMSLVVQGKPFFPVMLLDQCGASAAARARALGVNLILNESCPDLSPAAQLDRLVGRELGILPIGARRTRGARLAGWTYPDEPENNGWTPAALARAFHYPRGNNDGLVSFVTMTSAFFRAPYRDPHLRLATVRRFAHLADVAGFDLYPLNHCQHDLASVYDAQRAFIRVVGDMPTFQWIETGPLRSTYCGGFRVTAAELRAEAWLAVVGGARGIGFFTHTLAGRAFDVREPVRGAMRRFASLASAVEPGLDGATIPSSSNSPPVKVLARRAGRRIYVFAVNSLPQPVKVQLTARGLTRGALRVFGENRSVSVVSHAFVDMFEPLAVHVYMRSG